MVICMALAYAGSSTAGSAIDGIIAGTAGTQVDKRSWQKVARITVSHCRRVRSTCMVNCSRYYYAGTQNWSACNTKCHQDYTRCYGWAVPRNVPQQPAYTPPPTRPTYQPRPPLRPQVGGVPFGETPAQRAERIRRCTLRLQQLSCQYVPRGACRITQHQVLRECLRRSGLSCSVGAGNDRYWPAYRDLLAQCQRNYLVNCRARQVAAARAGAC